MSCTAAYTGTTANDAENFTVWTTSSTPQAIPRCDCGGIIKPDVVLYEEALNDRVMDGAVNAIAQADLLIVGGTSLNVWPAAGLINYFRGRPAGPHQQIPGGAGSGGGAGHYGPHRRGSCPSFEALFSGRLCRPENFFRKTANSG